jgi:hypothetical protein
MYNNKYKNQNGSNHNRGRNSGNSRRQKSLRANAYQATSSNNSSNYRRLVNNNDASNQNKKPDDIPGAVPMLQYRANAESNLSKWIEAIQPFLESLFGHLASFIATDKYYLPKAPAPRANPWTKATDPGGIKRAIEKAKATEYARDLSKIEADKPKMWGEIEKHMSTESKAQVKLDVDYSKLKENHDVLGLWRLIKQVHRTQAGKLNVADASLDALTNYYTIKQKDSENIVQFKDRLVAAVERVKTADPTKAPPEEEQARKFTKSLDPRKFNRLILECEQNEAKYEKTLAGALQQASLEKRLEGNTLVPCDQMIRTGGHFAGAMLGENGETIKLSRKEQKIIMNIRKERQSHPTEFDDDGESRQARGQKRGHDEYTAGYTGGKRPRYDKPSYDNNRNRDNRDNNRYNSHDKEKRCVICNMDNHWTNQCRNLTTAQNAVTQAKNRYRSDQTLSNNQANFGSQQRPILSGVNPLNQALTTQRGGRRIILNE